MLRNVTLARRAVAESIGTALLLAAVVGSGIAAQRLSGGNAAIALLANSVATGGALVAIVVCFGPISGAHFNPAVSFAEAWRGALGWRDVPAYVAAQLFGAIAGVAVADAMFGLPAFTLSHHPRTGAGLWLGEAVATFGLLAVVLGCGRAKSPWTPLAVAAYIVGAYWFTSSTSFANPAVTIARSLTDTFAGIRPIDVAPFVAAQCIGTVAAVAVFSWFGAAERRELEYALG